MSVCKTLEMGGKRALACCFAIGPNTFCQLWPENELSENKKTGLETVIFRALAYHILTAWDEIPKSVFRKLIDAQPRVQ